MWPPSAATASMACCADGLDVERSLFFRRMVIWVGVSTTVAENSGCCCSTPDRAVHRFRTSLQGIAYGHRPPNRPRRRVWGGVTVKDEGVLGAVGSADFRCGHERATRRSERRAVLNRVFAFETHRWKSVGGPQSRVRVHRAQNPLEPQTAAHAVTASGQLSLGSLDDARGA